jgi:hypothetical protein
MLSFDCLLMLLGAGTTVSILIVGSRSRVLFGILVIWTSGLLVGCLQLAAGRGRLVDLLAWLGFGWVASGIACVLADLALACARVCLGRMLSFLRGIRMNG